jgi:hypothetical protein
MRQSYGNGLWPSLYGFGFVTFKSFTGVVGALKELSKKIDDRMTVCNFMMSRPPILNNSMAGRSTLGGGGDFQRTSTRLIL